MARYGYFSGINRKIQFKYLGKPRDGNDSESSESRQGDSGSDEKSAKKKQGKEPKESKNKQTAEGKDEKDAKKKDSKEAKAHTVKDSKEGDAAAAAAAAAATDQKGWDEKQKVPVDKDHSLLLILKWGGELTTMGKEQALELGRAFRYHTKENHSSLKCCRLIPSSGKKKFVVLHFQV